MQNFDKKQFTDDVRFICNSFARDVDGWFAGGSYRFHPHGFCRDGFLIYDHHNVNDYLTISIAESPDIEWTSAVDHPTSNCNPLPQPKSGRTINIWTTNREIQDGPWKPKLIALIAQIKSEVIESIEKKKASAEALQAARKEQEIEARNKIESAWS